MYEIVFSDEALKYISTVTKKERAQINDYYRHFAYELASMLILHIDHD
ncbi:hypothetical protein J2T61_001661 [Methanocalculus sp. AMF5]|nr:hypothetical protein [Methanocalculus sp. AMF5]